MGLYQSRGLHWTYRHIYCHLNSLRTLQYICFASICFGFVIENFTEFDYTFYMRQWLVNDSCRHASCNGVDHWENVVIWISSMSVVSQCQLLHQCVFCLVSDFWDLNQIYLIFVCISTSLLVSCLSVSYTLMDIATSHLSQEHSLFYSTSSKLIYSFR